VAEKNRLQDTVSQKLCHYIPAQKYAQRRLIYKTFHRETKAGKFVIPQTTPVYQTFLRDYLGEPDTLPATQPTVLKH